VIKVNLKEGTLEITDPTPEEKALIIRRFFFMADPEAKPVKFSVEKHVEEFLKGASEADRKFYEQAKQTLQESALESSLTRPRTYPKVNGQRVEKMPLYEALGPETKQRLAVIAAENAVTEEEGTTVADLDGLDTVEKAGRPEHWDTGIKVGDDGTKLYRAFYKCPECGEHGKRYIPEDYTWIRCHHCEHQMTVEPATSEPFPAQDSFGNFFRAGDAVRRENEQ
jgi:DNA-directed RNA polymerase subunit RPC12/RpoP